MMHKKMSYLLVMLFMFLASCGEDVLTGPAEVKWDRDNCQRCKMMLSDRQYAAEVRYMASDKQSQVYKFDDLGCAVIWLQDKSWRNDATTEIWVTDQNTGKWLDARKAYYSKDRVTPMGYGLGAQADRGSNAMDFAAAQQHILVTEEKLNRHNSGGHTH